MDDVDGREKLGLTNPGVIQNFVNGAKMYLDEYKNAKNWSDDMDVEGGGDPDVTKAEALLHELGTITTLTAVLGGFDVNTP